MPNDDRQLVPPVRIWHLLATSAVCAALAAAVGKFSISPSWLWMTYFPVTVVLWTTMTTVAGTTLLWRLRGRPYSFGPPDALIILPWFFYTQELVSVKALYQPAFAVASLITQQKLWGSVGHRWIGLGVCAVVAALIIVRPSTGRPWKAVFSLIIIRCVAETVGALGIRWNHLSGWIQELGSRWVLIARYEWAWAAALALLIANADWQEHRRDVPSAWTQRVQTWAACTLCLFQFMYWGDLYLRS